MQGGQDQPEKAPERYGGSYLALDGASKKRLPQPPVRRKSGAWLASRLKELVLLVVILGVAAYFFRGRLEPVLAGNPYTVPLYKFLQEKFPETKKEPLKGLSTSADMPDNATPMPAGGEVTFSSGQGFGTVSPDDGSDSFRVVVPPEEQKPR